jgi:hypothetical protein
LTFQALFRVSSSNNNVGNPHNVQESLELSLCSRKRIITEAKNSMFVIPKPIDSLAIIVAVKIHVNCMYNTV